MNNTSESEQWTLYSAAQNLPAVLNNPNLGKQANFFTRTWGDTFIEKTDFPKSPYIPEITYSHFENYLVKYGKRIKRHKRLLEVKSENKNKKECIDEKIDLQEIPEIFLSPEFKLTDSGVFSLAFQNKDFITSNEMIENLSRYLDIVEMQIAKHVSQKSDAFFHAMTSHDVIMEQMKGACIEVNSLRGKLKNVDQKFSKHPLYLLGLQRSLVNHKKVLNKLKLMSTVLQTQPNIQVLLSSSDYVSALELIEDTQEVLAYELAGVTSLRHLPSQLKEISKLISTMLSSEFRRYAELDLHRSLENDSVLDPDHLISLICGMLKQNHVLFLDIYKKEAITATQTVLKQFMIEALADVEDDEEQCLTGSGEVTLSMEATFWMRALTAASDALQKLLKRISSVIAIIQETVDASSGISKNSVTLSNFEPFLSNNDHKIYCKKLKETLTSLCDYSNERLASLISTQSDKQPLTSSQIIELSKTIDTFSKFCEDLCGKQSPALRAAFKIQAGNYVYKFHQQRKNKLTILLDAERWKPAEIPLEFQKLVDKIQADNMIDSLPSSPKEEQTIVINDNKVALFLKIDNQQYVTVGTVLILIRIICEYCICAYEINILAPVIGKHLAELLRMFNSRSCQLVLGAGALKTAGLKTITSTNLALTSRSLQLALWLIPHIKKHFNEITIDQLNALQGVQEDIENHIQQLEAKVLSIIENVLIDQLNEWDAKPPVPSKTFRNISRHISKLHEAVSSVLPHDQVSYIYEIVHKNFKSALRNQLLKLNIQNNGGPQHGVVTTEITFYLQTLKSLNVLSEDLLTNKYMEDIWIR